MAPLERHRLCSPSTSTALFGVPGLWRCGCTGLIRQWGVTIAPSDQEILITLPIAFPNAPLSGSATQGGKFSTKSDAGAGLNNLTRTTAILRNGVGAGDAGPGSIGGGSPMYWEIWGY